MIVYCATAHFLWATSVDLFLADGSITFSLVGRDEVWCRPARSPWDNAACVQLWDGGARWPSVPNQQIQGPAPKTGKAGRCVRGWMGWGGIIKLSFLSPSNKLPFLWFFGHHGPGGWCVRPSYTHSLCPIYGNEPSALSVTAAQIEERLGGGQGILELEESLWQTGVWDKDAYPVVSASAPKDAFRLEDDEECF